MEVERKRLLIQAKKEERLNFVYEFGKFIPSYSEQIEKEIRGKTELEFLAVFDINKKECFRKCYRGVVDRIDYDIDVLTRKKGKKLIINIKIPNLSANKEVIEYYLSLLTSSRYLHFADEVEISVKNLTLRFCDFSKVSKIGIPKRPWRYRLSIKEEELYDIKLILSELFQIPEVSRMILLQTKDRKVSYEKIHVLGRKEEHLRWRDRELSPIELKTEDDILSLLEELDAAAFYFKPKSLVNKNEITTRNVIELDPRFKISSYAIKTITLNFLNLLDEFNIPYIYGHSGSKSARVHMEMDSIKILENVDYLENKFPFIGYVKTQPVKEIKDRYERVIKAFNKSILLLLLKKLKEYNRFLSWDRKSYCVSILFDNPKAASICFGSPKALVEVSPKERNELEKRFPVIKRFPLRKILTVAVPLKKQILAEKMEILKETNYVAAKDKIQSYSSEFEKKMGEKVSLEHLENLLESVNEEEFFYLNKLAEKEFKELKLA